MPRKKKEGDGDSDTSHVSLRMRKDLLRSIDELFWHRRTDRTIEMTKACEFYVTAITCLKCSTLNDRKANYCSVCLEPLSETAKKKERMTGLLDTIVLDDPRYQKILEYAKNLAKTPQQ